MSDLDNMYKGIGMRGQGVGQKQKPHPELVPLILSLSKDRGPDLGHPRPSTGSG